MRRPFASAAVAKANAEVHRGRALAAAGTHENAVVAFRRGISMAVDAGHIQLLAIAGVDLAGSLVQLGNQAAAIDALTQAEEGARLGGDVEGAGKAAGELAALYQGAERFAEASAWYERALLLSMLAGDEPSVGRHLYNQGVTASLTAEHAQARECWIRAADSMRRTGDREGLSATLSSLAASYSDGGQPGAAVPAMRELLELLRGGEPTTLHIATYRMLRGELEKLGEWEQALATCYDFVEVAPAPDWTERALVDLLALLHRIPDGDARAQERANALAQIDAVNRRRSDSERIEWLNRDGTALMSGGGQDAAEALFSRALDLARQVGDRDGEATSLLNLGVRLLDAGRAAEAAEQFRLCLHASRDVGDDAGEALAHAYLGRALGTCGDFVAGLQHLEQASSMQRSHGPASDFLDTLITRAELLRTAGRLDDAVPVLEEARALLGDQPSEALLQVLSGLGLVHHESGRPGEAVEPLVRVAEIVRAIGPADQWLGARAAVAHAHEANGAHALAVPIWQELAEHARQSGDADGQLLAWRRLGNAQSELADYVAAEQSLRSALDVLPADRDPAVEADLFSSLATVAQRGGRLDDAIPKYERALALREPIGDETETLSELLRLSVARLELDDQVAAEPLVERSLELAGRLGNPGLHVAALVNASRLTSANHPPELRTEYLQSARQISLELGDLSGAAAATMHLGQLQRDSGSYGQALETLADARELARRASDPQVEGNVCKAVGLVYRRFGDYGQATWYFQQALDIARATGDRLGVVASLSDLGVIDYLTGESEEALGHYFEALNLADELGAARTDIELHNRIGLACGEVGRSDLAVTYLERALEIARTTGDRREEANVLLNLTMASDPDDQERGGYARSVAQLRKALTLCVDDGFRALEAHVRSTLGLVLAVREEAAEGLTLLHEGLRLATELSDAQTMLLALNNLGFYHQINDQHAEAAHYLRDGVSVVEGMRHSAADADLSAGLVHEHITIFQNLVLALLRLGEHAEAFEFAERAKGRALLDLMTEATARGGRQIDPDLVVAENQLHAEIFALGRRLRDDDLAPGDDTDLRTARRTKEQDLARLQRRTAATVEPGDLAGADTLTLDQVQQDVLRPDEVLVEYLFSESHLAVFVVASGGLRTLLVDDAPSIVRDVRELLQPLRASGPGAFSVELAETLHARLIEPVLPLIGEVAGAEVPKLVVAGDGVLSYLPFECLLSAQPGASRPRFLVEDFEVSYASSASVLGLARRLPRPNAYARDVVAVAPFADMGGCGTPVIEPSSVTSRSLRRLLDAPQGLPFSGDEVDGIAARFDRAVVLRDEAATQARVVAEAQGSRYLHLATHGYVDPDRPAYTGLLLRDDLLQVYELLSMRIDAELTVLSACETGLGRLRMGEGLVGLARAFLHAGCPSLVLTLWRVADESTAQMMIRFYGLLADGVAPAAALRGAKLWMITEASATDEFGYAVDLSDPYYWSPFVLSGSGR